MPKSAINIKCKVLEKRHIRALKCTNVFSLLGTSKVCCQYQQHAKDHKIKNLSKQVGMESREAHEEQCITSVPSQDKEGSGPGPKEITDANS